MDEEYENFLRSALADGKLLGLLLLFSFSSILIELLGEMSFTVILSGEAGAGKTTLASLACSLFYPASEELFTANSTAVGLELAMKSMKNLPVLLDEGALRKMNLQDIVFMVAAGKSKLRGTKHLTINLSSFSSVLFYTSEASELSELSRGGAFRRLVYIPIKRNDTMISDVYSIEDLIHMRKYWGAGLEFVKRIQEEYQSQSELWKEAVRWGEEKAGQFQGFSWLKVVYATLYLLQHMMGIQLMKSDDSWTLESMLEEVMQNSLKRFNEESNTCEKFIRILTTFITQNMSKFIIITPQETIVPKVEAIGYRAGNELGVLADVFEKLCDERGFTIETVISDLDRVGILKRLEGKNRRKSRKFIGGVRSEYYVFDLAKLSLAVGLNLDELNIQNIDELQKEEEPVDF